MQANVTTAFQPRKMPVQTRATVTVGAIGGNYSGSAEPRSRTIGNHSRRRSDRRIRGNLYQYYPNKQSLLFAVFEDHMDKVARAVEAACAEACHKPMSEMIRRVVEEFVDVKMQRADISVALYKVAPDVGGAALVKQTGQRLRKAIETMLLTAPDLKLPPDRFAVDMMLSVMSGAMRSALEVGASRAMFRKAREHLVLLCQSYMAAAIARG